jgi:DNA mismatch repair protein MutS2
MQDVRKLIAKNFQKVVKDLQSKGLLAETEESFQNERRVLAVISSYKKQVNGIITGSSKTGSVTYIEPAINIALNNELEMLKEEELREIRKILRELTQRIRSEFDFVKRTLNLLIHLDSLRAKARLGKLLNGIIPQFSDKPEFSIVDGIHPLLYLSHHEQKKPTFAQSVTLHSQQRILVISGPNAGGKSVTLKMIGLLQMMFQCAIPIPVHETSKLGIFHHFLTDIDCGE